VRSLQLPYSVHLREQTRNFFAVTDGGEAAVEEGNEDDLRPLAGITVLERYDRSGHEIRRLEPSEALRALLPHAYRFSLADRRRTRQTMESYLDLVARVPVLSGRFSPGFELLPEFLDQLEASLRELLR
jgi:hypothetical protein